MIGQINKDTCLLPASAWPLQCVLVGSCSHWLVQFCAQLPVLRGCCLLLSICGCAGRCSLLAAACMEEEEPGKRRRLSALAGTGYVSTSALSQILGQVDPGSSSSRSSIRRQVNADLNASPYGPCLVETDLAGYKWTAVNPFALLSIMCEQCPEFSEALAKTNEKAPCSAADPWRLIFYVDEATPGNLLRADNTRKAWLFYWSIAELGPELLCKAHMWFLGGVLLSTHAKAVGGLSFAFKKLLGLFFGESFNFSTSGAQLSARGSVLWVFAKAAVVVADEPGLKHILGCKGAGGTKPCFACKNVVSYRSELVEHAGGDYLVDIRCTAVGRLDLHSDASVFEIIDRLAAARPHMRAGAFKDLEQALGYNHDEHGLLQDLNMRGVLPPITSFMYDFMHVYLVSGIANHEVHHFLQALKAVLRLTFTHLRRYLQEAGWHAPAWCAKMRLQDVFSEAREKATSDSLKAGASELLSLYAPLRHLIETMIAPTGALALQCDSLLKLCTVLDGLQVVSRGLVSAEELGADIARHLDAYAAAYPDAGVKPKHHYALHLPLLLQRHGAIWGCFVHERKHKGFKQFAPNCTNMAGFERAVAADLVNHQVNALRAEGACKTGTYVISDTQAVHGMLHVSAKDLAAFTDGRVGMVRRFLRGEAVEEHMCSVHLCEAVGAGPGRSSRVCRRTEREAMIPLGMLEDTLVWAPHDSGSLLFLAPPSWSWRR